MLKPEYNDATIRLLNRHGVEVVSPKGEGCCGALVHHMGRDNEGHGFAKKENQDYLFWNTLMFWDQTLLKK